MAGNPIMSDEKFMAAAIALGARGLGRTAPNPAVGALIVQSGLVVGRGWTQPGGRPHAETVALQQAGAAAYGATCFVTLEPCSHHGKTPPCADALTAAGIRRVVIGCADPDPRVAGRGVAALKAAGVEVRERALESEARRLNAGFLSRIERGRPMVTLKLASTADGRSATSTGDSRWITGPQARIHAHGERARHDAIMVGAATVIADDPSLTCRIPGIETLSPLRIVIDRRRRIPPTAQLLTDGQAPTLVICGPVRPDNPGSEQPPAQMMPEMLTLPGLQGRDEDIDLILSRLAARGLTRILVESGGRLAGALLRRHFVDRIDWYRAPSLVGGDGLAAVGSLGIVAANDAVRLVHRERRTLGADWLDRYDVQN